MPTKIPVLAVQSPPPLGSDVLELGHHHLSPLVGWLKRRPFLEQNHFTPADPEAYPDLVPGRRRYARSAERRQAFRHLSPLDLGQRHARSSPTARRSEERRVGKECRS